MGGSGAPQPRVISRPPGDQPPSPHAHLVHRATVLLLLLLLLLEGWGYAGGGERS